VRTASRHRRRWTASLQTFGSAGPAALISLNVPFAAVGRVFALALRGQRGERLPHRLRADFWEHFRRTEVRRFRSRMCAGYQGQLPRLPGSYARVACPTLALWGERDGHFPLRHGERLAELVPRGELRVLPDGPHWMVWSRAEEVAARILSFTGR
jgi:pimeloyl-ACP methyl ester carboxylesterase